MSESGNQQRLRRDIECALSAIEFAGVDQIHIRAIKRLMRSRSGLIATNSKLHGENIELRHRIAMLATTSEKEG